MIKLQSLRLICRRCSQAASAKGLLEKLHDAQKTAEDRMKENEDVRINLTAAVSATPTGSFPMHHRGPMSGDDMIYARAPAPQ